DHGAAGPHGLAGGADSSLVDDGGGTREEGGKGRVIECGDARRQGGWRSGVAPDQEDGAAAEAAGSVGALEIETPGGHDGGGAQREHDRRRSCVEEGGERGSEVCGAVLIEERKAGDDGGWRPVRLSWGEPRGEEHERERGRVLSLEQGIVGAGGQA